DPASIIAVALIDLHLEHRLSVSRVDADHRQAKSLELGPKPRRRRSRLKAYPNYVWSIRSHERSNRLRIGIDYTLSHHRSRRVHHADRRLLQRHVQSNIALHRSSPSLQGRMRPAHVLKS